MFEYDKSGLIFLSGFAGICNMKREAVCFLLVLNLNLKLSGTCLDSFLLSSLSFSFVFFRSLYVHFSSSSGLKSV